MVHIIIRKYKNEEPIQVTTLEGISIKKKKFKGIWHDLLKNFEVNITFS